MFGELGLRVLAVDLDPQANLTSAFLDEDQLVNIWEESREAPNTIFRCIRPLLEVGDIRTADRVKVTREISLIPGDLALSGYEDELSAQMAGEYGRCQSRAPLQGAHRLLAGDASFRCGALCRPDLGRCRAEPGCLDILPGLKAEDSYCAQTRH